MIKTAGSRQTAVGMSRRERSVFDRLRAISSLALVAVLALAALIPGRAALVFAQRPQAASAAQQATVPAQVDYGRLAAAAAAQVTEFDVNGLRVLVKRREGSLTASAGLFIRGGSTNITADNAGIEGFMLAAATEASANFPRERMRKETARLGTVIGGSANYDYSVLSLTSTRANFDRSWEIFTDVALHPSFTKEDVGLLQARLVASLRGKTDDPDNYLQRLQERVAYAGHPYLNRPDGTADTISALTAADLRAYHQKIMQTSRLLLVIVGDLDAAQLKTRLAASFGKLPRGDYKIAAPPQLSFTSSTIDVTPRDLKTNYVQGLFTAPPITSPDIYPMRIAASILRDRKTNHSIRTISRHPSHSFSPRIISVRRRMRPRQQSWPSTNCSAAAGATRCSFWTSCTLSPLLRCSGSRKSTCTTFASSCSEIRRRSIRACSRDRQGIDFGVRRRRRRFGFSHTIRKSNAALWVR